MSTPITSPVRTTSAIRPTRALIVTAPDAISGPIESTAMTASRAFAKSTRRAAATSTITPAVYSEQYDGNDAGSPFAYGDGHAPKPFAVKNAATLGAASSGML